MRRIFATGLLPAAVFDAAVNGVSDQEALTLRRLAATACSPRARGRSLALVTLIHQLPTWRAEVEVILQYARQVWNASLLGADKPRAGAFGLTEIADKWRAVDKSRLFTGGRGEQGGAAGGPADAAGRPRRDLPRRPDPLGDDGMARRADDAVRADARDDHVGNRGDAGVPTRAEAMWMSDGRRRAWKEVKGPVGAMLLSLHRIGWKMPTPFTLVDDWDEEIPLTKVTPALLTVMLRDATFRAVERYAGAKLAAHDDAYAGRRVCVDHIRRQLATDRKLSPQARAVFLSALCGAIMTFNRAASAGYLVHDICPLCGQRGDTLRHRVWECTHEQVAEARRLAAPAWLREEVARRPATQSLWINALLPHPGDTWPRPAHEANPRAEYAGVGDPPMNAEGIPILRGQLYVDGSCSQHVIGELRRAATAIVAKDPIGGITWRIGMPVPSPMLQTSQVAEHVALPMVQAYLRAAEHGFDVASDCAGVVRACNGVAATQIAGAKVFGGILKPILSDLEWQKKVRVRKVPAHVNPDTPQGAAREDALGNGAADEEAKRARGMHPRPSPAQEQDLEADLRRTRYVVRTVAATLACFPPMPKERMQRRPVARDGAAIAGQGGHDWIFRAGLWRCSKCWIITVKADIRAKTAHGACAGPRDSLVADTITAKGHKLAYAEGSLPVMFCWDCGAFSARRAYGLGSTCRGTPTPAGAQALARIKRGEQPWQNRGEQGRPRVKLGAHAAWSTVKRAFVGAEGDGGRPGLRAVRRRRDDDVVLDLVQRGDDDGQRLLAAQSGDIDHGKRAADSSDDTPGGGISRAHIRRRTDQGENHEGGPGVTEGLGRHGTGTAAELGSTWRADVSGERTAGQRDARRAEDRDVHEVAGDIGMHGAVQDRHGDDSGGEDGDICGSGSVDRQRKAADVESGSGPQDAGGEAPPRREGTSDEAAVAKGVSNNAIGARVGPGGPQLGHATAAVALGAVPVVTAAVVIPSCAVAHPHLRKSARAASAVRGEATGGPPDGAAAPSDGSKCMGTTNRPDWTTPHKWPQRLGVGRAFSGAWMIVKTVDGPLLRRMRGGGTAPMRPPSVPRWPTAAVVQPRPEGRRGPQRVWFTIH